MGSPPDSPINLEFLPDWAREPAVKSSGFSHSAGDERPETPSRGRPLRHSKRGRERSTSRKAVPFKGPPPRPTPSLPSHVDAVFLPEFRALQSVGEQIRTSHRAYPLFGLAKMFLEKPERHLVLFRANNIQADPCLFQCTICGNLSMDESGITTHVLRKHRALFYEEERIQSDPPKGNYTSVARCSLNGALLGPTNYHAYQSNLMQLYKTQFSHLSFDRFKQSVVSVHDPEIVAKWKEDASWKKSFKCLQVPEPLILQTEADVERHFRQNHFSQTVRQAAEFSVDGQAARQLDDTPLTSLLRQRWEEENRFPMKLAQRLREEFFKMGLHVFKAKKGMQFVSIARPKPLLADEANVSKMICTILEFVRSHPGKDRKSLIEALCPSPETASIPSETSASPTAQSSASAVIQDLLWLLRQGHVIEYNNGTLEISNPAAPKTPPSKAKQPSGAPSSPVSEETASSNS